MSRCIQHESGHAFGCAACDVKAPRELRCTAASGCPLREEIDRLRTVLVVIGVHANENGDVTITQMARTALWGVKT